MLGDISPQTVRITQQAVVYPSRDHATSLRVERFDGRSYRPVDMTAVTRVILSFPEADPVIVYDSSVQAVFTNVGSTLTVDLSDYAMPSSVLGCQIILYDAEHPAGQVLVDDIDAVVQFDFRNVSPVGGIPAPAVDYLTDAPIDGVTYARKDGVWVPVDALVSGVSSVNGQSGVVVLDAADVGADAAGTGASQAASAVAAHVALSDPHPQYLTPAEGNTAYDAIGAAASAVGTHVAASDPHPQYLTPAEGNAAYDALGAAASAVSTHVVASDPHPQYNTQAEGDARYERNLTAGANITIDRTNPAAPVISASGGGGGGGAVDSVNGQTGVVVLDTDDIAEGVSNLYFTNGRAAAAAPVQTVDGQAGAVSLSSSYAPLSHVGAGGAAHSNAVAEGAAGFMTGADKTKLDGIASGATVNATNAELRDRSTHTGSQLAATISDFAGGVRGTVLTGLSLASAAAGTAADTVLVFLGKLQAQITALATTVGGKQDALVSGTNIKTVNGISLLGGGNLAISGGGSPTIIGTAYPDAAPPSIGANYFFNDAIFTAIGTEHPEQWVQVSGPPNGHFASVSAGYPIALNISRLERAAWLNASGAANAILPTTEISFPQWMAAPTGFFLKVTPATDGLLVKANLNFWVGWSAIVFRAGGLDLFSPVATERVVSIAVSTTVIIRFEFEIFEDDGSYGLGVTMSAEAAPRISDI